MQRVFVLGDSRTGTTSLHRFFMDLGFNSIHFYLDEAGIRRPASRYYAENWSRLKEFYLSSPYNAFSDYPTRIFYRDIYELFPDAYFILSERASSEIWRKSAAKYFPAQGVEVDVDKRTKIYDAQNKAIREFFAGRPGARFLCVTIDDDSEKNSQTIKKFLGVRSLALLHKLNASSVLTPGEEVVRS